MTTASYVDDFLASWGGQFVSDSVPAMADVPAAPAITTTAAEAPAPEPENYRDKAGIAAHFGMSVRWVEQRMQLGMPHDHVSGRARFRLSEVAPWLCERGDLKPGTAG